MERPAVLVANGAAGDLTNLVARLDRSGYDAVGAELEPGGAVAAVTERAPALLLVVVGASPARALQLIGVVAHETLCPVVAVLDQPRPGFARLAAAQGCYGVTGAEPEALEAALHCAIRRQADYVGLLDAFARRAVIEQAKGLLMAEQRIEATAAFELLRGHSQRTNRKVADVAGELIHSHGLLLYAEGSRRRNQPDLISALVPSVPETVTARDPNRDRGKPKRRDS
jgi:AmiR/NasT family two-component response regulator